MKQKIVTGCKELVPVFFLILGIVLYFFISGCRFLGIVAWGVTAIVCGYRLLALWEKRSRIAAKVVRTIVNAILTLVAIAFTVTLMPILRGPAGVCADGEYMILLGAGVKGTTPSEILQYRIDAACAYLTEHPDVICIASGGKGDGENISEAQCIYEHLTAMGIEGERIWLENRATSTIENFRYSLELIESKTGSRPAAVTVLSNEFHLYRANRMASDCGLQAQFISAPTENFAIRVNYTIREVFALWKYLIVGG